uniref:General transcription factor IIIC, polypeptide 1, alpha 220kDa n=2 Tax=Nothobranchius korthausae TaxID=1143690 RepID=A0A1A8EMJ4_9TELE
MEPLSIVVDEVALEGLDGITIPSLWIRLEDRRPKFPLKLDDCTKGFIWSYLVSNVDLRFYELPQERENIELFDRFKGLDPDTGVEKETLSQHRDVYPIHVVPENKDGIQGSCAFFKQRKDITKKLRSQSLTPVINLEEALKMYGRKLVVVASQALRFRSLIGPESDPDLKLTSDSYCVLERVGRGRWQGELQRDLHGGLFKVDARKLHYLRKSLVMHDLITMQSYVRRLHSGQRQHSVLLLLKRFHISRRSKYDLLMESMSAFLQELPSQFSTVDMLKEHLNVTEPNLKRLFNYMRSGKFVQFCHYPLEDLCPSAGPCKNKNGSKVLVRCVKLLKPYTKKSVPEEEEDEDDEDEEDYSGARKGGGVPTVGRIMERDMLCQAYDFILFSGTKGVSQRDLSSRLNVNLLESRITWRKLVKDGNVKPFMEDVGRQRMRKFISHRFAGVSDKIQMFAKEQQRKNQLFSAELPALETDPASHKTPGKSKAKPSARRVKKDLVKKQQVCDDSREDVGDERADGERGKTSEDKDSAAAEETQLDVSIMGTTQAEAWTGSTTSMTPDSVSVPPAEKAADEEQQSTSANSVSQTEADDPANKILNVDGVFKAQNAHETYRVLKRKNLIVEAVRSSRIVTSLYELQKKIIEDEQKDGLNSKCCKKTILRLVNNLSREGLVKMYSTTVIQEKITRKIDLIVHPSVQPDDESVKQVIEQIRFKISSSCSALRLQQAEGKTKQHKTSGTLVASKAPKVKASKRTVNKEEKFKPTTVPGLGKRLGFQPKMQRLRAIHTFLWYLIYGHPQRNSSTECKSANTTSLDPNGSSSDTNLPDGQAQQDLKETESSDLSFWDKEKMQDNESNLDFPLNNKVFVDEDSWRRFVPPVRQHEDFSSGWASVGDVLLCMPLSIFLQFTQINYKVDGLEELVNDPMKQHYLVSSLPPKMQRELLFKRKYILMFNENLQRLVYMGLLHFAPTERFKDKDQMFMYLKRNATIVDTTSAEPHYWQVSEPPDKPFERRSYTLNTADDVESYWFDLMCVCLNTPLGVIRSKRVKQEGEPVQTMVYDRYVFAGLAHMLKGSNEVCDDGSIPGDGKGAAGLDSEFFGHLKRNWLWTSHLLLDKTAPTTIKATQTQNRLKGLLNRDALRIALQAGDGSISCYLTSKRPLSSENVEVGIEPVSRVQQGIGGKGQKRMKVRKQIVKVTRKKRKEPKPRAPAHDEADHRALKMMTKRRVYWTIQEDSVIMLCAVASYLLNSKLKKVYVPYCIVRDLLHAEFQISEDKTSLAVGRRTKYILKNPQTYLNFRICLAEVYQDTTLLKHLEENKPVCPDKAEDCAKSFSEYIRLLRQKFSAVTSALDVIFPDSTQELFSRFKVSAIDDETPVQAKDTINSKEDIHATVLYNLIHSTLAMTNGQMKTSRSFQTFHIYSQYDQELLCKVFLQTRVDRLVNRRRVGQLTGPKKNRSLPILPMSFQLSQSYYKRFLWRFPSSLCTDSFCFLRNLLAKGSEDGKPFTSFYHETENRSQNSEEVLERKTESSRKTKQSDSQEDGGGITRSQKQTADVQKTKEGDDEKNKTQSEKSPNDPADSWDALNRADGAPEEPPDVSDMLRFTLNSPGGACAASLSLMSLGLLNVFVSIPKQIVVVDSNLVDNDVAKSLATLEEEDDEDEDDDDNDNNVEGRKGLHVTSHQASHTNFLLMRGYCCPGIVHLRNLPTNDYIVVESCIVSLKLRGKPAHHLFSDETPPQLDLTKCGPSLLPSVLTAYIRSPSSSPPSAEECDRHFIEERGYTDEDIEVCAQLRRSLDEAGMNGLDERDLYGAHLQELQPGHTRNLQQYLKDLQEEGQVVRVGSLGVRWVLMQHADPWLLTVNCKQTSRSKFSFERQTSLKSQPNIPSKRKRCHPEQPHRTEEPPAKKQAVEEDKGPGGEDADGLLSNMTEKPGEEKQLEQQRQTAEDGGGDVPQKIDEKEKVQTHSEERRGEEKSPNLEEEGEMQTCPEREKGEDGQEKMETEQKLVRKRTRSSNLDEDGKEEAESVPTESADDERENVSFISRPWRFTDGKVNRPVCKGLLEAVLYHIMSLPGVTQQALLEHYKNALQPVVVLDLLQALIELGCVTKKTLVKEPKPSLFARSVCQNKSVTNCEEAETVFYEPTISCCLRLCQILPNERLWNDIAS